jgi:hypothetical protein
MNTPTCTYTYMFLHVRAFCFYILDFYAANANKVFYSIGPAAACVLWRPNTPMGAVQRTLQAGLLYLHTCVRSYAEFDHKCKLKPAAYYQVPAHFATLCSHQSQLMVTPFQTSVFTRHIFVEPAPAYQKMNGFTWDFFKQIESGFR